MSSWPPNCAQPSAMPPWMASRIVGSAPRSRSVSHGVDLPGLGGDVDRGYAHAVVRPAEGSQPVRLGAELDERPHRRARGR